MAYTVYLDFQGGAGYVDYTSYIQNLVLYDKPISDDLKSARRSATFTIIYKSTLYSNIVNASEDILVQIKDGATHKFTGYIPPVISRTYDGTDASRNISVEAVDFSEYLKVEVGEIAYENKKIFDPADTANSIVHLLFTIAGLAHGDYINGSADAITTTIRVFSAEEDEMIFDLLDKLLYEYGYVLNWNEEGKFEPLLWKKGAGYASDGTFDGTNIIGSIEKEDRDSRDYEGADIRWNEIGERNNVLVYRDPTPYDSYGNWSGIAISNGDYYPVEANVVDPVTTANQVVHQEYTTRGIEYLTNKAIAQNLDYHHGAFESDFETIEVTKSHALQMRVDDNFDPTLETESYGNKKAQILYLNSSGATEYLYYLNIYATVVYRKNKRKSIVENVASTKKLYQYIARFVFTTTNAESLAEGLAKDIEMGNRFFTFKSEASVDPGSLVTITTESESDDALVLDRTYDANTEIYTYYCKRYDENYNSLSSQVVLTTQSLPNDDERVSIDEAIKIDSETGTGTIESGQTVVLEGDLIFDVAGQIKTIGNEIVLDAEHQRIEVGDGDEIILDGTNKKITINNTTFGDPGIQLEYNAADTPRFHVGDGTKYLKFDGTNFTWEAGNTSMDSSGNLTATSATITGEVNATSGTFDGVTISGTLTMGNSGGIAGDNYTLDDAGLSGGGIALDFDSNTIDIGTGIDMDGSGAGQITVGSLVVLDGDDASTISGWILDTGLLKSAASGARIELNQDKNRVSIFDSTDEAVAIGYLNALPKRDGSGVWGANDRGLWSRPGDSIAIDGDVEYVNGDYLVENDSSYRITTVGASKGSLFFDGAGDANDYVQISDASDIQNIFDGGGTISAWIKPESDGENNYGVIISKETLKTSGWFIDVRDESAGYVKMVFRHEFDTTHGVWNTVSRDLELGVWSHLTLTYNSDDVANDPIIKINNETLSLNEGSTPVGTRVSDVGDDLHIGNKSSTANTFDGNIDDVRLYNRLCTPDEAESLYTNPGATIISGMVGRWSFDEDSGTTAFDSSGNGNDGTISGATRQAGAANVELTSVRLGTYSGRKGLFINEADLAFDGATVEVSGPCVEISPDRLFVGDSTQYFHFDGTNVTVRGDFKIAGDGTSIISGGYINTDLVQADSIEAGAITTTEIASDTIVAGNIAGATITIDEMAIATNFIFTKSVGNQTNATPSSGDIRSYLGLDPQDDAATQQEIAFKRYNGATWENKYNVAMRSGDYVADMLLSGYAQVAESALSAIGTQWRDVTTSFGSDIVRGIAYGNSTFVAVGASGKIAYSTDDGDNWTQATTPSFGSDIVYGAAYGNSTFVAVGASGKIAYSTDDGDTWEQATTPSFGADDVFSVAYGDGTFVAVGDSGKIAYSTDDGDTWEQATTPSFDGSRTRSIAYGNSTFVAVGISGKIAYSTDDGDTWEQATTPSFGSDIISGIAYGDGTFVAVGDSGKIAYSTDDGDTWEQVTTTGFSDNIIAVSYGDNVFVAVGSGGEIGRSTDGGVTWGTQVYDTKLDAVQTPYGNTGYYVGIAFGNNRFVAVGYLFTDSSGIIIVSEWLEAGAGIVEKGENTNGEYIKFSNGVMLCWVADESSTLSSTSNNNIGTYGWSFTYASGHDAWTFPEEFLETPTVLGTAESSIVSYVSKTTTTYTYDLYAVTSTARDVYLIAIGRWK